MPAHAVTFHLSGPLYDHFKERAKRARRSLEAELLKAVEATRTESEELPLQLARVVHELQELDDGALWRVARDHLPRDAARELEALNHKQQREGLSSAEEATLTHGVRNRGPARRRYTAARPPRRPDEVDRPPRSGERAAPSTQEIRH